MKQRILALLLAAGLCLGIIGACIPAALAADETGVEEAVEVLAGLGIVSGCSDGSYHPEDNLTRAQFCKLAVLAEGHGDKINAGAYRTLFSDVPGSNWAAPYVNLAYEEGLVSGYGDGTFGPDDAVTTAQAATIVLHLLGYTDDAIGPFWPEDAMSLADSLGLLDGLDKTAARALSRGDAALLLYHLLDQTTADGRDYYTALCSSAIKNALLLDNDSEASDGTLHTALVYADNALTCYEQADCLPELLVGRKGTLLLDSAGKVVGFLPDDTVCRQVVPVKTTSSALTGADGAEYSVNSALPVLLDGEKKTYGDCWYDLAGRAQATLYYASSGNLELIVASEAVAYEGVTLTGYYENAAPNTDSPTRITLLGITLDVADTARGRSVPVRGGRPADRGPERRGRGSRGLYHLGEKGRAVRRAGERRQRGADLRAYRQGNDRLRLRPGGRPGEGQFHRRESALGQRPFQKLPVQPQRLCGRAGQYSVVRRREDL